MKYFMVFLLLVIAPKGGTQSLESIKEELKFLKKICDEGLLNETECKEQKAKILSTLDKKEEEEIWFCNYGGESVLGAPIIAKDGVSFSESSSAKTIVREILDEAGLVGNFIVRASRVPNAAAIVRGEHRYIEYNPEFVRNLKSGANTNWAIYSVLAHEIGHHLQGHTLQHGGSRPDIELEADEYSGFILAKLGASLENAQKAMKLFGSDSGSYTHPAASERLVAIENGWKKGAAIITETDNKSVDYLLKCVVNDKKVLIDEANRVFSKEDGIQVGQLVPPNHPDCAFNFLAISSNGMYCIKHNECTKCGAGQCKN